MGKGNRQRNGKMLSFVLLLPLMAIIIYLVANHFKSLSLDDVKKITIDVPGGSEEVVLEDSKDIDMFLEMINGSGATNSAIRDISGELPVLITFAKEDKNLMYEFYPSLNLSGCILVSPEEDYYILEPDTAAEMLLRTEFEYLYSESFLPKLVLKSGDFSDTVLPTDATWSYYKSDNELYDYVCDEFAQGDELFTIYQGQENSLSFVPDEEVFPCDMDIVYTPEGGEPIFNIKDISELDLTTDTFLDVTISAKWAKQNAASAFGEAQYSFRLLYDVPAVFELEEHEEDEKYSVGDVIAIYASYINASEEVRLSTFLNAGNDTDRIIDFDIVGDGNGVALIPIGLNTIPSNTYTLNVTSAASQLFAEFDIGETDFTVHDPILGISEEDYRNMLSKEKYDELFEKLAKITAKRPDSDYIDSIHFDFTQSKLSPPVEKSPKYGFGDTISLGTTAVVNDGGERTSTGLIYEVSEGTSVRSVQKGEIVFSGEFAPTGNTVVVYHGYGIYSYYFHLAEPGPNAGYVLGDGEIIGEAGTTGFTNGKTILNFAVSIDGVFINPECLFED